MFNSTLRVSALIFGGMFVCAAIAEWIKSAYAPFHGFAAQYEWINGLRTYLYLMTMFNILLIRYVIMRIYISPGDIDFSSIVKRLSRAGIASMLTSVLPCLYGLLLYLLAGDLIDFYLLFGLSVIYCMIYFPRHKNWVSLIEQKIKEE